MNLIKKLMAGVGVLGFSIVGVVLALDSVVISPAMLDVAPGDTVEYTTTLSGAGMGLTYDWFIDGTFIASQTGAVLSLSWAEYLTLFPADATMDSSRVVTLIATDDISAATGAAVLSVTQPVVVPAPVAGRSSRPSGGDNYCGDGELKIKLGEECDDGNGKNGDGCTINCECEKNYDCLEDGTITFIPVVEVSDQNNESDENSGNNTDSSDENDDMDDDTPGIKDMLADRNRTPLDLGNNTPANAKVPLNAPETGASLEQLRLMGIYVTSDAEETVDISSVLPKRAAGYVAHPVVLPLTGTAATHRPARTIIL